MAAPRAMLRVLAILAVAAVGRGATAQSPRAEETILRGVVVDEDGQPVAGAVVKHLAWTDESQSQTTDGEGRFAVPLKTAASGWIYAGLRAETGDGRLGSLSVEQRKPEPVRIVVKPPRELTLLVQDREGRPVFEAPVEFLSNMRPLASGRTDAAGQFTCRVPADAGNWAAFARKSQVGFDYATSERGRGSVAEPHPLPERLTLKLDGARTVRIKAVDRRGKPLAGVRIGPWTIHKPDREADINLSGTSSWWPVTGEDGLVVLDWLPERFVQSLSFINRAEGHYSADHSVSIRADEPADELTFTLLPLEKLSGRVTHADGRPAAAMNVTVRGQGTSHSPFHGAARTDAEGCYELDVYSEQAYLVVAGDEDFASPVRGDIVVRPGQAVAGIDLVLGPATRVHGRVTLGEDRRPVAETYIAAVTDLGAITDELPRKPDDRIYYGLSLYRNAQTDADGRYEFHLGPGEHQIRGPARTEPAKITISAEGPREIVQDFHMPRAETGPLAGRVVDEAGKPVAGATVQGRYSPDARRWFHDLKTDERGRFRTERSLDALVLHAKSSDGKLAGIARSEAEATEAEIVVRPAATATGHIKDLDGKPVAGRELRYGIRIYTGEPGRSAFSDNFGGVATTDENGEFTLAGLIPGEKYQVSLKLDEHSSRTITQVTAEDAAPLSLGNLAADPNPTKPYVPPTPAERTIEAFAARKDTPPAERLANLLAEAKREYTRPLLLFGTPADPACIELYRLFHPSDADRKEAQAAKADFVSPDELRWEFELAALDLDRPEIRQLAESMRIDLTQGQPVLAVLDQNGKLAETHVLKQADEKLDPRPLGGWLARHKLPTRNAVEMYDQALAQAKAEDKRVFFILSASWCGPCRLLARFLAPHKAELEKHFVFVKLDVSRDERADELRERFKESQQSGVPWFCILDAEGQVLATSNLPKVNPEYGTSNMGFPTLPAEVEHFAAMLKLGAPRLADETLAEYKTELLKKK